MREPRWLGRLAVDAMHSELLLEHGGAPGIRDEGLVESALARPQNRFLYEPEADLANLAAAYLFGFVKNHGFVDGNKRIGFAAGCDLPPPQWTTLDGLGNGRLRDRGRARRRTSLRRRSRPLASSQLCPCLTRRGRSGALLSFRKADKKRGRGRRATFLEGRTFCRLVCECRGAQKYFRGVRQRRGAETKKEGGATAIALPWRRPGAPSVAGRRPVLESE